MVFGVLMQLTGMLAMVAQLVGSTSVAVGWPVHLAVSLVFGAVFALLPLGAERGAGRAVLSGAGYGVVLWLVGPLLLMPALLGMPLAVVDAAALRSVVGHLLFGAVLGAVTWVLLRRDPARG